MEETIERIEKALQTKLYPWQKELLVTVIGQKLKGAKLKVRPLRRRSRYLDGE
ncbi:hypothetical protein [Candidatus Contubernalis alkaliaceticus]|uniref:hypothetical protein n=1 Tax=Candidatus Contubernalis alkaliaceticus TaxID=338645 RepID=UPI001F4C267A|nr:hypothetical protein [Candidatus Contubernalis alkalaceticus]UNC91682.1 hypothetical protein HUE98_05990 [Candidatus Contubernalis alkalaceticus]